MVARIAILADDLTGALDTGTPFAARGLSVSVALRAEDIDAALDRQAEVIVVNTASRDMVPEAAAARVTAAVQAILARGRPGLWFKKIDSRLKGNIAAEAAAICAALGLRQTVVAPAVPDQARIIRGGAVQGRGVAEPIPVLPSVAIPGIGIEVVDAESNADLRALVARFDGQQSLAIGARGLGQAFAWHLAGQGGVAPPPPPPPAPPPQRRTLFAFGSRDPITMAQIAHLSAGHPEVQVIAAPAGQITLPQDAALPLVVQCSGAESDPDAVASAFARTVVAALNRLCPDRLVMGGGDTALAICQALGLRQIAPGGEVAAGLPWFLVPRESGDLTCVVKSGGFGAEDVLTALLPPP